MCDAESSTCPYCGDALTNPRRVWCGNPSCKKERDRDRTREFHAKHRERTGEGYRCPSRIASGSPGHYPHVCAVCGKTFKSHKNKQAYCSVECWRDGGAERRAEKRRQKRLPILHPGPYSWLPERHPAMLMQQRQTRRLFTAGHCLRCGRYFVAVDPSGKAMFCSDACSKLTGKARRRARKRQADVEPYSRREVFEREGWRCHLCGRRIDPALGHTHRMGATIDHIVPIAAGGGDTPANVRAAHRMCNSLKGDRGGGQFRLVV